MKSFSDANFFEGQFKVIRGRPRSNGFIIVLLYGHGSWKIEPSFNAKLSRSFPGKGHPIQYNFSSGYSSNNRLLKTISVF